MEMKKMDADLSVAVLSLIISLLPGILTKIMALGSTSLATQSALAVSPKFNATTIIIAFVLGLYALARSNNNVSTRTIAIITIVVCVLKLLLQA